MTTLNDAFKEELTQEDEEYESGSGSLSIPTPLQRSPCLFHVSASENLSFNPATPLTTVHPHPAHSHQRYRSHSPLHHSLIFNNEESHVRTNTSDRSPSHDRAEPSPQLSITWLPTVHLHQTHMTPSRMLPKKKKKTSQEPH